MAYLREVRARPRGRAWWWWSSLAVDVLVAVEEGVDVVLLDRDRGAELARDVHGAGDVLAHHRGLDRGPGGRPDAEDAVVLHEHCGRAALAQGLDDPAADRVVADDRERP